MKPDFIGLAPLDRQTVYQEIVVKSLTRIGERACEFDSEQVDVVLVKVDVRMQMSRNCARTVLSSTPEIWLARITSRATFGSLLW